MESPLCEAHSALPGSLTLAEGSQAQSVRGPPEEVGSLAGIGLNEAGRVRSRSDVPQGRR